MGEKTVKNTPDSNFAVLAEAIVYLADMIRAGCADVADGLRNGSLRVPPAQSSSNQMDNTQAGSQAENRGDFSWQRGADEIPDMRDDLPLPQFGRKAP